MLVSDNLAQVAFVDRSGDPLVAAVWYDFDGTVIWLATTRGTRKGKSLSEGSRVAISILDKLNPLKQLLVKGVVEEVVDDDNMKVCDRISWKYLGKPFPARHYPNRVAIGIKPVKLRLHRVDL